MAGTFKFELVSPERILMSEDAEQVVLPGSEGDFAVLAGHAPLVSTLRPGVIEVTLPGSQQRVFVKGGFVEVEANRLTVLAEKAFSSEAGAGRITEELKVAEAELAAAADDQARLRAHDAIDGLRSLQFAAPRH